MVNSCRRWLSQEFSRMLKVATVGRYVTLPTRLGGVRTCFGGKSMMEWVLTKTGKR